MRKQRTSPAISYLLELTIALFFFALSSIIIITLFTRAHSKQLQSNDTNNAILIAQSLVADLKNTDQVPLQGSQLYNENIQQQDDGSYVAKWTLESTDYIYEGTLEIWKDDTCVLSYPFGLAHREESL